MIKTLVYIGVVVLVVFSSVKLSYNSGKSVGRGEMKAEIENATPLVVEEQRTNVRISVLKPQPISEIIALPCSVEPYQDIQLASELSGSISAIGAEEGDSLKKGQMILTCDVRTLEARLADAAASKRLAELSLQRLEELKDNGFVPEEDLDRATTELQTKEAALRLAEIELEKAVIHSPIDGILDLRPVDAGEYVLPGQTVARLVDISKVKAVVKVPELHVAFLRPGLKIQVMFPHLNGSVLPQVGPVKYLSTVAEEASRTFRMEIELKNPDLNIRPGMIGKVYIERRKVADAIKVPIFAVVAQDSRRYCLVEVDGVARTQEVTLGITDGKMIQVTSGLEAGDRLIVVGHRELEDGDLVQVMSQ